MVLSSYEQQVEIHVRGLNLSRLAHRNPNNLRKADYTCQASCTRYTRVTQGVSMSTEPRSDTRTRWGRTRFAGGRIPAMAIAIPIGMLLAIGTGAITLWTGVARGEQAVVIAGVFALVMVWGLVGLVWALIVDRSTLRGAIDKPDDSIESKWLDAAMAGAFSDIFLLVGLGVAMLAITDIKFDVIWALSGVLFIAMFSVIVRYLIAMKRN